MGTHILAFQVIEYGLGLEHKASGNVAETFLCDVAILAKQVKLSKSASMILSLLAEGAKGKKIRKHYASWKTGASNDTLSSQVCAVKKIYNNHCKWEDPLPNAMYPNATIVNQIFFDSDYASTPWGREELKKCIEITNNG